MFYWLWYYSCSIFFSPLFLSAVHFASHPHSPPTLVHVHGSYIQVLWLLHSLHYFLNFLPYLFIFRERVSEGERKGEKHQCVVASCMPPNWGPGLQPRHVPQLGIEQVTLCFTVQRSIHWAIPTRAPILILTSPYLFCTNPLCLFPVPFPSFSLLPLPADNPPCDLHFWILFLF